MNRTKVLIAFQLLVALALSGCVGNSSSPSPPAGLGQVRPAKNVILFIGDGMGVSTVTAARIYDGQQRGETGEENLLSFERFPDIALVKTYNTNQQVPDSAGTASAMMTGVKTRAGMIGVGPTAHRGDCSEAQDNILPNVAEQLAAGGKAIGIVSTARLTHATPAAVYGHVPERDWEADSNIPAEERAHGCRDLATQLMEFSFDVALGGGRSNFFGEEAGGNRLNATSDLQDDWAANTGGHYVTNASAMHTVPQDGRPLLGLFSSSHMTYMLDRQADSSEPTLSEMTATAIDRLSQDSDGYFLMVEGGRIDHGHHEGRAAYALEEAVEFSRAVQVALDMVDLSDTLILVTADHSHVFTIAGYPTRGNPILGLAIGNDERGEPTGEPILATDGHPYTTLGYQNGPGATPGQARGEPSADLNGTQQALVPTGSAFDNTHRLSETHGGEDVALYATGPGSEEARGVIEQNRVFDIIMRALGFQH
ncbi:alkaline phosphatase [Erythrobacter aureus]|uniref:Alkaline phosphatase n=1 Tax=Erythrobacter aureus TaxID=2182384 RepID=A0A345YHA5_9SPHN|nr:alkaline phosphatase [Erythrobacter aureus]AXK43307.1 alkaline phosphatase [Erythrobacter aureus]